MINLYRQINNNGKLYQGPSDNLDTLFIKFLVVSFLAF